VSVAAAAPVPRVRLFLAFAAIYVFWSASFLAIRWMVAEVPPLLAMAIRCAGGAALLIAWLAATGGSTRASAAEWRTAAVAGLLLFAGCHGLLASASRRVTSGECALYLTSIPMFLVVISAVVERKAPRPRVLLGLAAGTLGIAILTGRTGASATLIDRAALVASGLAWAAGSLWARHGARPASSVQSSVMQLAAGAVSLFALAAAGGEFEAFAPENVSPRAIGALAFLVLGGTVLGFAAYTWLLRVAAPAAVGTYAFVNPVLALGLAIAVGDEAPSGRSLAAAALVVGAVLLCSRPPGGKT